MTTNRETQTRGVCGRTRIRPRQSFAGHFARPECLHRKTEENALACLRVFERCAAFTRL